MPALPDPRHSSRPADPDEHLLSTAPVSDEIAAGTFKSMTGGVVDLPGSIFRESSQTLVQLLSQGASACSDTEIQQILASLAERQKIWESNAHATEPFSQGAQISRSADLASPIGEMFLHYQQISRLRDEITSRGEELPPSLGPRVFTQQPRLHAQILSVAIDSLVEQLADISIKGAIPALLSFLQSQAAPIHRFGTVAFSSLHPAEHGARLQEGQQIMRDALNTEPQVTLSNMLRSGFIDFQGDRIAIAEIRFLADREHVNHKAFDLEIRGANPAIVIQGFLPNGEASSLIVKKEETGAANHFAMSKITAALGLRSYRISSLFAKDGEKIKDWLVLEKLPSHFIGFSDAGRYQPEEGVFKLARSSALTNLNVARELGSILAVEFACAAQDCLARHILLDWSTYRPFRIDWEYAFQFEDPFNLASAAPYCMQGDEENLLNSFVEKVAHLFGDEPEFVFQDIIYGPTTQLDRINLDINSQHSKIVPIVEAHYSDSRAREIIAEIKKRAASNLPKLVARLFNRQPSLHFDSTQ